MNDLSLGPPTKFSFSLPTGGIQSSTTNLLYSAPNPSVIPYGDNQPADPSLWNGNFGSISLFGSVKYLRQDTLNMMCSLQHMATFIRQRSIIGQDPNILMQFHQFGDTAWDFLSTVYELGWDKLHIMDNTSFRDHVSAQFNKPPKEAKLGYKPFSANTAGKQKRATVSKIPPPILSYLSPEIQQKVLEKINSNPNKSNKQSFAQATRGSNNSLLKLREAFPKLPAKDIIKMNKIGNNKPWGKPKIKYTTKGPSRKNFLIPLVEEDKESIFKKINRHIRLINNLLKSYKSATCVDCIYMYKGGLTISTNSVALTSDLELVKQYFKGLDDITSKDISPRLPQSKSFLNILGIPYSGPDGITNIKTSGVEAAICKLEMFSNIILSSHPCIIKASRNSDISVIWVDIWDSQNSTQEKKLINRSFNYRYHIATIRGTTINPGVPQCWNCWK